MAKQENSEKFPRIWELCGNKQSHQTFDPSRLSLEEAKVKNGNHPSLPTTYWEVDYEKNSARMVKSNHTERLSDMLIKHGLRKTWDAELRKYLKENIETPERKAEYIKKRGERFKKCAEELHTIMDDMGIYGRTIFGQNYSE